MVYNSIKSSESRPRLRHALIATTILATGMASSAFSQTVVPPPVRANLDGNGVDLFLGTLNVSGPALSVGDSDGIRYQRIYRGGGWSDNMIAAINIASSTATVTFVGVSDSFTLSNSIFTATEASGATLTFSSATNIYTYTSRDGTVIRFDKTLGSPAPYYASDGRMVDIEEPDRSKLTFSYDTLTYCTKFRVDEPDVCQIGANAYRIGSARNNNGWRLTFNYAAVSFPPKGASAADVGNWSQLTGVTADNLAAATSASASQTFSATSIADALNRVTTYRYVNGRMEGIKTPAAAAENMTIGYDTSNRVMSVTSGGTTTAYAYAPDANGERVTTVTDSLNKSMIYKFNVASRRLLQVADPLTRVTTMTYDTSGRMVTRTYPEGNKVQYIYDNGVANGRGNVTETRVISKTPGTPPDLVTTASFPATCTNARTCNQPIWTKDAKGSQTDYTYDPTHGGVLTVMAPAAITGGTRPQTRYGYSSLQAYYKNSAGSIVASGAPTFKLTEVSACQTTASCSGTADEVKTVIDYGPQVAGTGNNLLPVSVTRKSGNNALVTAASVMYDSIGNPVQVDGPLPGAADTTRTIYDAARQAVGVIGPDPDGAGAMKNRAQRMTYNADGQVTLAEVGTTAGQSDANWAAFTSLQQAETSYDAKMRPVKQVLKAGGTTYAVTQSSYDAKARSLCTTVRMDQAQWAGQVDACIPQTTGPNGPDRVSKTQYDDVDRTIKVQSAVGTTVAIDEVTTTYGLNDQTATVADAKGNLTTYEYDGFIRPTKTRFPTAGNGAVSSTTDFEGLTYDAVTGNVTQRRLRDGQLISFSYDLLNRVTTKDVPGTEPDVSYTYDLLSRMTAANRTDGQSGTVTYDALGRPTAAGSTTGGSIGYSYDSAGRRTQMVYSGSGLTIDYDYLVTGELSKIRENGATSGVGVLGSYSYNDLGQRTTLTRGNGAMTTYAFDPISRLQTLTHDIGGTTQDVTTAFTYNPASQIKTNDRNNDIFAYREHYNLTRPYAANGLNQLTTTGPVTLAYDLRGNLTTSGTTSYTYTSENLLSGITGGATLKYDPLGRLLETIGTGTNGVTTRFSYDGDSLIAEYDGGNTLLRRYVHGPGADAPLVWYEGSGTTNRRWLIPDERGSIIAVTDGTGAAIAVNSYDSYGIPALTNLGRFQYTGQTWIPELGMYNYKARIYSATLGRFMQTDPIGYGDGMNMYAYVGNDPVNFSDPSGTSSLNGVCQGSGDCTVQWVNMFRHRSSLGISTSNGSCAYVSGCSVTYTETRTCVAFCGRTPTTSSDDLITVTAFNPVYRTTVSASYTLGGGLPGPGGSGGGSAPQSGDGKASVLKCLGEVAAAGAIGALNPVSVILDVADSISGAQNRTSRADSRPQTNEERVRSGGRLPRDWGSAVRIGLRRFAGSLIPTPPIGRAVSGAAAAAWKLASSPSCGVEAISGPPDILPPGF